MAYNFGEKNTEYHAKLGKDIPVWKSPKYEEAKKKAIEIIDSGKYNVTEADFWILMNATKTGKMAYTGLIISHNGCLKINDSLADKFNPDCVFHDKEGYNGSLVFHYCNTDQGIYEVGEVSKSNCQNDYPYAMAYKRLFDRVVLKLSKLAYSGIYSDSESEEFSQQLGATNEPEKPQKTVDDAAALVEKHFPQIFCQKCSAVIEEYLSNDKSISPEKHAAASKRKFGRVLCLDCIKEINDENAG